MELKIPHRRAHGMCPVNGIRNLVHWRTGRDWSNQFLYGLGLGGGFAYLRFNLADPPRQVYWGIAGPRQHRYLADLFNAGFTEIEKRTFKFSWRKAQQAVDAGTPPVIGPLDMYHLPFYEEMYHLRHIPIHYLLLVGYDDDNAHVIDTDKEAVQTIGLDELELAWDVTVPGLGHRNRLVVLEIPEDIASTGALIRRSIADQCQAMLNPPVSMVGIPAMQKVAQEIAGWPEELGNSAADACLRQVREYLNSPPDLLGDHLTGGRDVYITFLEEAGPMAKLDFSEAIVRIRNAMAIIPQLAQAIQHTRLDEAGECFHSIAEYEKQAYEELGRVIGMSG